MPLDDVIIIPRYCTQRFNLSVSGTLPLGSNSLKEGMTLVLGFVLHMVYVLLACFCLPL